MQKPAIEFLFAFNAAITNIRLYPPSSPIIQESIVRMQKILQQALEKSTFVEFAESDKKLLVYGHPLAEKQQKKPQVSAFLSLMADLGIKSIRFSEGIETREIFAFINIFARTPEQIEEAGGPGRLFSEAGIKNISIDEKVYVTIGQDQRIVSGDSREKGSKDEPRTEKTESQGEKEAAESAGRGSVPKEKPGRLKDAVFCIMRGDNSPLADPAIAAVLPAAVGRMIEGGRQDAAFELLRQMGKALTGDVPEVRSVAAQALENVIKNLSASHIVDLLLKDFEKKGDQKEAFYVASLLALYTEAIERLLDRLRDSSEKSERNRTIQAITHIGQPAVEPVIKRINQDAPWYYIRNLALLLGRIGGEKEMDVLEPLIAYPDYRVQLEAVKSIQSINGEKAGAVLLKNIEEADPRLAGYIISVIGALRYQDAAPYLIEVLESKRLRRSRAVRDEIMAKACEALGRIQAVEAVSALEKIVRERGLLKGYPEKVRTAATKALFNIKRG